MLQRDVCVEQTPRAQDFCTLTSACRFMLGVELAPRTSRRDAPACQPRRLLIRNTARGAERRIDAWRRAADATCQWRHRGAQFHDRVPVRTETGGFAPPP